MRRLYCVALLIIAAATTSGDERRYTRFIRVSLRCKATAVSIVLNGDDREISLDPQGQYWRKKLPSVVPDDSVASLHLSGHRTFARIGDLVPDDEINENVLAFDFFCDDAPAIDLRITPAPSIHFSYCRQLREDPNDRGDTHNRPLKEGATSDDTKVLRDWRYRNEGVRLLLYSDHWKCDAPGILLNELPGLPMKNNETLRLTNDPIDAARCRQQLKGVTSAPRLFCLRDTEHPGKLTVDLVRER